ncbi:MAG: DNA polymerase III subunit alpha [Pseudomonadota bacterium]
MPFVHLRTHTEFSIIDGLVRIKPWMKRLAELNMPAAAMTDDANLFGLVKFQRAAHSVGIKPIFGADLWLFVSSIPIENETTISELDALSVVRITVLAQNTIGYRHITQLISLAYTRGRRCNKPCVDWQDLVDHQEGLIILSGGIEGELGKAWQRERLKPNSTLDTRIQRWFNVFGNRFYLEIERLGRELDEEYVQAAVEWSRQHTIPLVATNAVCFLKRSDFDAHEIRVCINSGHTLDDEHRPQTHTPEQYLKSTEEMTQLFQDIPDAIANTFQIALRCSLEVPTGIYHLPNFPTPNNLSEEEFFREASKSGLEQRLQWLKKVVNSKIDENVYWERLNFEMKVIIQMGFAGYFLIVMDFIRWSKKNDIPVGPGRGSGAGSLVAYALEITDIDPLKYDLLFERFLNPERVSMPDFDVDFCIEGRDRVIEYVAGKFGREAVSQIITFGSMAAKAVVRDVGRVMGKGYGFVDSVAKLIPFEIGMTLEKAMAQEELLQSRYDNEEDIRELLDYALQLEGLTRNVGKHAGGVVIAPTALTEFVPLYCDEEGQHVVTQFDKDDVESVGLLKFDFLGLRTLTIIKWGLRMINAKNALQDLPPIDIAAINLSDVRTFNLLQAAETTAIFQLESRGMKDLIKRLKPSCFEDIIALVALFRPGPLQSGMVDDFIHRKHGISQVEYSHPKLEPILKTTYGVILYQEQVMQIAQVLAGYTLGEADMLRRAMGKKKPEEMAKQRSVFLKGAKAQGIEESQAAYIFDLMEKFAGYGFNKSHSAAYALISYQTAWIKTHFPSQFMAAVLSADMHNTDKVVQMFDECQRMRIKVVPPHVNASEYIFTVNEEQDILYGLGAIKGVGEGPISAIIEARKDKPFVDLFDFCLRVSMKKMNRRSLEGLIKAGALDELGPNRATLLASVEDAIRAAQQHANSHESGMFDLFGGMHLEMQKPRWAAAQPWTLQQRLQGERDTLGLFLSGHPIDAYQEFIQSLNFVSLNALRPTEKNKPFRGCGYVLQIRMMKNKRGERMAFLMLDDKKGRTELSVFSDAYLRFREILLKDRLLSFTADVQLDEYSGQTRVIAREIFDLEQMHSESIREVSIALNPMEWSAQQANALKKRIQQCEPGDCKVHFELRLSDSIGTFGLPRGINLLSDKTILQHLIDLFGNEAVTLRYEN